MPLCCGKRLSCRADWGQWPDMLEIRKSSLARWILTCAMLLGIAARARLPSRR
jgi:hypothetical protein